MPGSATQNGDATSGLSMQEVCRSFAISHFLILPFKNTSVPFEGRKQETVNEKSTISAN